MAAEVEWHRNEPRQEGRNKRKRKGESANHSQERGLVAGAAHNVRRHLCAVLLRCAACQALGLASNNSHSGMRPSHLLYALGAPLVICSSIVSCVAFLR